MPIGTRLAESQKNMSHYILACFVLGLSLGACAGSSKPAPLLPDPGPDGVYTIDWPDLGRGEARYITIDLGPDSFSRCQRLSPKFPFDSARTRAQDRAQLSALASCLNHREMSDRSVLLIGRTDAQGSEQYNLELGAKRAARIKELLVSNGLAENRIRIATAGEVGAMGDKPDYSKGYDRRVDIHVIGGVHAP